MRFSQWAVPVRVPSLKNNTALEWIAKTKLGITEVVHVIDDFLIMARSPGKCAHDLQAFSAMCKELGVPLAPDKTMGASTCIPFLGITLDTVLLEARLPEDKLAKARHLLREFLGRQKVTLRELQSLIGVLNFACSVIVPGRAFLRRLIDLTMGIRRPHHHVRLTREVKSSRSAGMGRIPAQFQWQGFFH